MNRLAAATEESYADDEIYFKDELALLAADKLSNWPNILFNIQLTQAADCFVSKMESADINENSM